MPPRRPSTVELDPGPTWRMHLHGAVVVVGCDHPPRLAHPYAPADPGDVWRYAISPTHGAAATSVERVLQVELRGDRLVARVRTEMPEHPSSGHARDLVITPDGVSPDIGAMESAAGPVTVHSAGGVFLPRELPPGRAWTWQQALTSAQTSMRVDARCEVVGAVRVAVPAGAFAAVHVRSVTCVEVRTVVAGTEHAPVTSTQQDDSFYARDVGLVRCVTVVGDAYRSDKQLVAARIAGVTLGAPL